MLTSCLDKIICNFTSVPSWCLSRNCCWLSHFWSQDYQRMMCLATSLVTSLVPCIITGWRKSFLKSSQRILLLLASTLNYWFRLGYVWCCSYLNSHFTYFRGEEQSQGPLSYIDVTHLFLSRSTPSNTVLLFMESWVVYMEMHSHLHKHRHDLHSSIPVKPSPSNVWFQGTFT